VPPPSRPPPPGTLGRVKLLLVNLRRSLALAWRVERGLAVRYFAAAIGDALTPVFIAYVGKQIVDHVVAAVTTHERGATLAWVAVELALIVTKQAFAQYSGYVSSLLRARLAVHTDVVIFEKAMRLSVTHFEDPRFMDILDRARRESSWRPMEMIKQGLSLVRNSVTLVGYAVLLAQFSGWAVLALALAGLPFVAETRYAGEEYAIKLRRTADERQSGYYQQLLTSDYYVKEVKLFALGRLLVERYQKLTSRFVREDHDFARRRGVAVTLLGAASALVFYAIYAFVVARTIAGAITLGSMTLYLTVFRQGQGAFQTLMGSVTGAYEDNLYITNLFEFLSIPDDDDAKPSFSVAEGARGPAISFSNASFTYPGADSPALSNVSFSIAPGETVALVGPNGAGKTTLVKLLTALYPPPPGAVAIDGVDVTALDRGALRGRIGVVFQDFVHYHFTAADNVGIGWLPSLDERAAVERAAKDGGAHEFLARLPRGYDTQLGRWFDGSELSIGQWQRVALARAFMRRSDILILDEPTSAIDAEMEHEIFQRFRELKANRTAILITHRFSTVRMADRIVVLERGRVVENGTHAELLAQGGLYARMFRLQAEGYKLEATG
jgi:ABC-type multidrug transport system fused ATPase/permease subunit